MDFVRLIAICFGLVFFHSCSAYDFKNASELTLFKNYALSSCVASNYQKSSIYQDAIDSLNGNREYASISLDAYYELNESINKWSEKKYVSKKGNVSEFFMCIDFQNSVDVLDIFKKYNPCNIIENWSSKAEYELRCEKA